MNEQELKFKRDRFNKIKLAAKKVEERKAAEFTNRRRDHEELIYLKKMDIEL